MNAIFGVILSNINNTYKHSFFSAICEENHSYSLVSFFVQYKFIWYIVHGEINICRITHRVAFVFDCSFGHMLTIWKYIRRVYARSWSIIYRLILHARKKKTEILTNEVRRHSLNIYLIFLFWFHFNSNVGIWIFKCYE